MSLSALNKIMQNIVTSKGFAKVMHGAVITEVSQDLLKIKVPVTVDKCNMYQTLHGGFTATVVDILSTMDLMRFGHPPGVSVDLSIQYLNAAPLDSVVIFESRLLKIGKRLAFCEVDIRDQSTNKLVAKGKHTKFLA